MVLLVTAMAEARPPRVFRRQAIARARHRSFSMWSALLGPTCSDSRSKSAPKMALDGQFTVVSRSERRHLRSRIQITHWPIEDHTQIRVSSQSPTSQDLDFVGLPMETSGGGN